MVDKCLPERPALSHCCSRAPLAAKPKHDSSSHNTYKCYNKQTCPSLLSITPHHLPCLCPPSLPTSRNHFCLKHEQPSTCLSNGVYAAQVYDMPLTALGANNMRSQWTLRALCGATAKAYSMKPRSDEPLDVSSCRTACDCEWIILEFCQILTCSDSIDLILDGGSNRMPSRLTLLPLL